MATTIKRIEKDFLLKVLFDEQVPLILRYGRGEYVVFVPSAPKTTITLKGSKPIVGLREGGKVELLYEYRGQTISFTVKVQDVKDTTIVGESPEFLYKNLDRSYSRVAAPSDLKISFSFRGDRYALSYPKTNDFEPAEKPEYSDRFDSGNIKDLINQLNTWAATISDEHKLVMFKDGAPQTPEERIISALGKALYIPSTLNDLPEIDLGERPRIITSEQFKKYYEMQGTDPVFVNDAVRQFLRGKVEKSIYADLWVPILFHEYVIGYMRVWITRANQPPFDQETVDILFQFASILAWSLKENGYFKNGEIKKELHPGKVIDVSASGMLFAHPFSPLAEALLPDSDLDIQLVTGKRTIRAASRIVRRYKDASQYYFGCRYTDIAPEDLRFLFEFIYGKALTDKDSSFLSQKA